MGSNYGNVYLLKKAGVEISEYEQYEFLDFIGRGNFGVVQRAQDKKTGEIVSMKMLLKQLSLSTLPEILNLKSLPRHPSVVELKTVAVDNRHDDVFVVMEYLENDLNELLAERRKNEKPFTTKEIKGLMKQLLEGVRHLHANGVMHRDLKPANILIDNNLNQLKICDFGCSTRFGPQTAPSNPYVGTRSYTAPELLARCKTYTCAVDMWSVGSIMAEVAVLRSLPDLASNAKPLDLIIDSPLNLNDSGFDLLERLLACEPERRITAKEALDHPWFRET